MKPRSAIKTDLFADQHHREKIDSLGDPLAEIDLHIDFAALATEVNRVAPRPVSAQGGRPLYPTETMVRILVLKRLYNLSDEQMEYQLLDRMSYKRFCGLANATNVPDRTTIWTFENRIGETGAKALFDGVSVQLVRKGFIARGGQIIGATVVPAPKQHNGRGEKELIEQGAVPTDWKPAKRRQKDIEATWTKKHGKSYFGHKLSINVDKKNKINCQIKTDTASAHDSQHFDNLFDTSNSSRDVYADWGNPSEGREAWLKENGFRNQLQRKGKRNKPLSECQQRRNKRIAKTRARSSRWAANAEHQRSSSGELCDDDDGGLLQLEAAGLFPGGRNRGLLTPQMGRIAGGRGYSRQKRGETAGESGELPEIAPNSVAVIVARRDSRKTSGYSRCP